MLSNDITPKKLPFGIKKGMERNGCAGNFDIADTAGALRFSTVPQRYDN